VYLYLCICVFVLCSVFASLLENVLDYPESDNVSPPIALRLLLSMVDLAVISKADALVVSLSRSCH
jgi:hypothetical protein